MGKKLKFAALVLAGLVIVGGLSFWRLQTLMIRHFYTYAVYANAIWYYHDEFGIFPSSLEQLNDTYGKQRFRLGNVPPEPPWPPPTFRPLPPSPAPGRYLVVIEPKPQELLYPLQLVIFLTPATAATEPKFVWKWEVDDLIAQDDRLRAAAPTTAASQP
jgi:hypothetical protein